MTTRNSADLPPPREEEAPLPANVRPLPLIIPPNVVLELIEKSARGYPNGLEGYIVGLLVIA